MMDPVIPITAGISLDLDEVELTFIRSGGPGGQNVNKVSTAVQLRFDVVASACLPSDVKRRLIVLAGKRATKDGVIVITAHEYRSQDRNREQAITRLADLITQATFVPKRRVATKATRSSKERRLNTKKRRSTVKAGRRGQWGGD